MDQYIKYRFNWREILGWCLVTTSLKKLTVRKGEELLEVAAGVPFGDFEVRGYFGAY